MHPEVSVTEARELITSFGNLKSLHADLDGRGKVRVGIWFEYEDPTIAQHAVPGLTGVWIKNKRLVAALATPDAEVPASSNLDGVNGGGAEGEEGAAEGEVKMEEAEDAEKKKAPCTYRVPPDAEPLMYPPQVRPCQSNSVAPLA